MPNYAHLIFHLKEETIVPQSGLTALQKPNNVTQTILWERITKFMKSIKNISAREANKVQKKNGTFWQSESYDHLVRDEDELERIIKYVFYNSVKAGISHKWKDWPYIYLAK